MSVPGGGGSCSETEVPTVAEPTTPTELDETEPDDDYESGVESCRQPSRFVACAIAPVRFTGHAAGEESKALPQQGFRDISIESYFEPQ